MSPADLPAGASLEAIADLIHGIRAEPRRRDELLALLDESCSLYEGRGSSEAERLRGFVLASFADTGLPEAGLPFVLEELETGREPYSVAAAARALRGSDRTPAEAADLIRRARHRIVNKNVFVDFSSPAPEAGVEAATAIDEIDAALARLERKPGCCCATAPAVGPGPVGRSSLRTIDDPRLGPAELEDQDGRHLSFADFCRGRAVLLAFFYTRCMNPNKCSLTVSRLGDVARRIAAAGLSGRAAVGGISYDPAFDAPDRLRRYGSDRGLPFSRDCCLLRTTSGLAPLREALSLGVGFGTETVNRHRLELFAVTLSGEVLEIGSRRQWEPQWAFDRLSAMVGREAAG